MIATTLRMNLFDQFPSSNEDNSNLTVHNDEIHSILVYIGLITVILFLIFVICSLIYKCMKLFHDEPITTKKKMQPQSRLYQTNSLTSRQTSLSSVSSSPLLTSYHTNKSLAKPSFSFTTATLQYQNRYSLRITNV